MQRLDEIRHAPSPFGLLQEVEALVATVEQVNSAAIVKARSQVLGYIDKQIERVQADLDAAEADADTRNNSLIKLQKIRQGAEQHSSLAHLYQISSRATDAAGHALEALASLPPPRDTGGIGVADAPVAKKIKPIQRIFASSLNTGYIQDEAAADQYLAQLRQQIKSALAARKRVDIR